MVSHSTRIPRLQQKTALEKLAESLQNTPEGIDRGTYMEKHNALEILEYDPEGNVKCRAGYFVKTTDAHRLVREQIKRGIIGEGRINLLRYQGKSIPI